MSRPLTVAVDANGADRGPREVARAAALAAARLGIRVLVHGPADRLGPPAPRVEIIDAPLSIAKAPDAARAVRATPEASVVQAARAVAEGRADALVSGGSTGTALAAALVHLKRGRGIHRPALAALVPVPGAPFLLLDAGANVAVRPEHLVQFAHMGAAFSHGVLGVARPRVALLANGEEPTKGTEAVVAAHARLAADPSGLAFVGNVEGWAIGSGAADVVVADGFTGNVALKLMEGVSSVLLGAVREAALASPRARLGGLLLRPALRGLRDRLDPEEQGGAVLLGLRSLVVVCHGSFGERGFARAIELAARGVREEVVPRTRERLQQAGALRAVGAPPEPSEGTGSVRDRP